MSKLGIWPTIQSPVVPTHRLVISGTLIVFLFTYLLNRKPKNEKILSNKISAHDLIVISTDKLNRCSKICISVMTWCPKFWSYF